MSDSFFGFDTNLDSDALDEGLVSDEEDEDYDALNDETFGEDVLAGDWEEDHEKLAELTELSRHSIKQENGDLSSQIAAFLLEDDTASKQNIEIDNVKPVSRPPPGFLLSNTSSSALPPLKNVCTVEEIERNLIKPPATSLRLEDLERKLIPPNPPGLNVRTGPLFSNITIQPPRQPILGGPLAKIPFPQFQLHAPHLIMPPGMMGIRGGVAPIHPHNVYLRLQHMGPGRGPILPFARVPPEDEYAGLMTSREKHWLASIQLMQLSTSTPFQDDYYYLIYQQRQSGHHGRKINCPLKTPRDSQPVIKPTYTPLQFENSLGKLQVGSVTAPRKIIDTDLVESVECTVSGTSPLKVKQILLEIEHMFSDVLLAEEALSPLASHSTDEHKANQLFARTVSTLLKNDKLKTVLNIRKGKTLILRVLSHLEVSDPLANKLITILPVAAKRDMEQAMLRALPAIRHYLASTDLDSLVELSEFLRPDLKDLLENKFGISVITNMMERAEQQMTQTNTESPGWISFVTEMLSLCPYIEIERPVVGIAGPVLCRHLSRCIYANNQHIALLHKALSTLNSIDKL